MTETNKGRELKKNQNSAHTLHQQVVTLLKAREIFVRNCHLTMSFGSDQNLKNNISKFHTVFLWMLGKAHMSRKNSKHFEKTFINQKAKSPHTFHPFSSWKFLAE
ncbi:hypothetical protein RhiirA1_479944 [Rhizophagus irregularis]|uniref:Uncharacterized protein n=1 Tax=Rhizophagus irregularis TaxID=588596 RepID=A0A2N0QQ03_9GLOM|nr:hypothetical protein RhiirA1_479944 [Rhizophagus irregularis]